MGAVPYYQVNIDHSPNRSSRTRSAYMGEQIVDSFPDVRISICAQERDWWDRDADIVKVSVSYTPFGDDVGSKHTRTREFADRVGSLLGTEVRIHDSLD